MDSNLFSKHIQQLNDRQKGKNILIEHIHHKTGIYLENDELTLSQKKITLTTSSVKKAALVRKHIASVVQEIGYTLT